MERSASQRESTFKEAKLLDWRLCGLYKGLNRVEGSLYMAKYDKVPNTWNRHKFNEKSEAEMKKIVDSGNQCNYFQSKIIYLYGRMDNVKIRIAQLGFEVGLNLQYEIPNISSRHFGKRSI